MNRFLVVLSAPSGAGKTTIARALMETRDDVGYSVSATTRSPREDEVDGVDYHFVDAEEFAARLAEGEFLESAKYGDQWYGTLESEVNQVLASQRHVILDIEVQGAGAVRGRRNDVVSIFILPPSAAALVERLGGRNTENPDNLASRLRTAVYELRYAEKYDYIVINDDKGQAVAEVSAIIDVEEKRPRRYKELSDMLATLGKDLKAEADNLVSR
ncbi:MAG: guanylate kinase [Gemmatimonadales bacterium]